MYCFYCLFFHERRIQNRFSIKYLATDILRLVEHEEAREATTGAMSGEAWL